MPKAKSKTRNLKKTAKELLEMVLESSDEEHGNSSCASADSDEEEMFELGLCTVADRR